MAHGSDRTTRQPAHFQKHYLIVWTANMSQLVDFNGERTRARILEPLIKRLQLCLVI